MRATQTDVRFWRQFAVTAYSVILTLLFSAISIYVSNDYGWALFVFIPLMTGALPTLLWGRDLPITPALAFKMGFYAINISFLAFFIMGLEGMICIFMAAIPAYLLVLCGSALAYFFVKRKRAQANKAALVLILSVPAAQWAEKDSSPELRPIMTPVEINAPPREVWELVIAFPPIAEPEDWLFRAGIAYPTHATIAGQGVGAVRHCQFTTGPFVEPITAWEPPHRLAFDVIAQPAPMNELSMWHVDAPHLHDFFVSERGQFALVALSDGRTRLEGTTWYRHDIRPAFYWQWWSDHIVHRIHLRVLEHIKALAEKSAFDYDFQE